MFPPTFLDDLRARVPLSQLVGHKVSWDMKKTNAGKGDYWAPCPFHQEKTASFHVDDQKGFYYCFGCQAKGDHIGFLKDSENMGFMQAVERLAGLAGMPMPARTPEAQQKYERSQVLLDIMEQAVNFYRLQLKTAGGAEARAYLQTRGLTAETLTRFDIGYAPAKGAFAALRDKGFKTEDIVECGLAIVPDERPKDSPFDRFRNRIMFPIRNPAGKCIAFGGRAMDESAPAKYLNSPETPLFDKGRTLYNFAPAREAAHKAGKLLVAEGYMDVIALAQYGFDYATAPLGTAITAHQLALMWQISAEPIIALDGDTAGLRAAHRLIDLALPILGAGQSLRFALLPEGLDPDDLLKTGGVGAMTAIIKNATPLADFLWQREITGKTFDTPEKRAALDRRLMTLTQQIGDSSLQFHYKTMLNQKKRDFFYGGNARSQSGRGASAKHAQTSTGAKTSFLAMADTEGITHYHLSVILCAALLNPRAASAYESKLEKCQIPEKFKKIKKIHNSLLRNLNKCLYNEDLPSRDSAESSSQFGLEESLGGKSQKDSGGETTESATLIDAIKTELGEDPMDTLLQTKPLRSHPYLQATAEPQKLERLLADTLERHLAIIGLRQEIADCVEQVSAGSASDESTTYRLQEAIKALENNSKIPDDFAARMDEVEEKASNDLQKMLDNQIWVKKKK